MDEICLRFLVKRKWKLHGTRDKGIPSRIRARVRLKGATVSVSIPTDVSEFRGGVPHLNLDLTSGITSRRKGKMLDYGSGCCMVRNADSPGERYLLSCYHVFSPTLSDLPGEIDCVVSASGKIVGPMLEPADPDGPEVALDAALALIEGDIGGISTWSRTPTSRATDFDIVSLPKSAQLFVHGRRVAPALPGLPAVTRLDPLSAVFQSLFPNPLPFDYSRNAGRTLYFSDTLQYVADVRPGDSGAAVMNAQGKLFGMHFYGQDRIGFALSAPRLFDPGVFPFDIVLA